MQGYPPNDAPQRIEKDRLGLSLSRLRGIYSDNLIEVVEWCMSLDPLSRPQSVFALQKELSREGERRYTKLTVSEKVRLQFDNMLNALRLREGFKLQDFTEKTGLPITAIQQGLEEAERKGLIERDFVRVKPTERGFDFLNDLQSLFLAG